LHLCGTLELHDTGVSWEREARCTARCFTFGAKHPLTPTPFFQAKTICRILGQRARDQGRLESALQWYLRAKDTGRVAGYGDISRQQRSDACGQLRRRRIDISPFLLASLQSRR
jgi:hypothetical protein